jgi:hypothetical protein
MQSCMKFFPFILFNKFYVCIDFCYILIFTNKFIKHNQIIYRYWNIKYINLYSSLNFFSLFFSYCYEFFYSHK